MDKIIVNLGRVNRSMVVKFYLPTKDNKPIPGQELINKFTMSGNNYTSISPHPYIQIDISSKRDVQSNGWDMNNAVALNNPALFAMKRLVRKSLNALKNPDMFYYNNGKLFINKELAAHSVDKIIIRNKYVAIYPAIIEEEGDQDQYEGLAFMINSIDHFCYMTIDEAEYLYDLLDSINMHQLSLQAMAIATSCKNVEVRRLEKTFVAAPSEEMLVDKTIKPSKETIPNI